MEFKHVSVLLDECIEGLNIKPDGIYVDGTLGGGGHSSEICRKLGPNGTLIGIDRDDDALAAAKERLKDFECKKIFVKSNYSDVDSVISELGIDGVDGGLLDLGVSSFQLDNVDRGFSYMHKAPLDMRMDQHEGFSAYDVVNDYSESQLFEIIKKYGEEKWASRIAKFIVKARTEKPIEDTEELVDVIKSAIPAKARREGPHPAKRTFQAIRIEVNDELGQLGKAVENFVKVLNPEGRLCIISFHSLEDRIVKNIFNEKADPCTCPKDFPVCVCGKKPEVVKITRKPIISGDEELEHNPRARSAKLRIVEKI